MRLINTIILILASTATNAATVLIDFDEVTPQFNTEGSISVTSKGYDFLAHTILAGGPPEAGVSSAGIYAEGDCFAWGPGCGAQVSMERVDNEVFSIHSFVISLGPVEYVGTLSGGAAADLSGAIGTGDWLQLEKFWALSFCPQGPFGCGEYSIRLDDITVSAVPIPAAVWLFGSGLGLLGWIRRRKTA